MQRTSGSQYSILKSQNRIENEKIKRIDQPIIVNLIISKKLIIVIIKI